MSSWLVLALLILSSAVPVLAVYFWFRAARYSFSTVRFLLILLTGAAAYFPALVLQSFFPPDFHMAGRLGMLADMFLPVALTEEFSRLVVLFIFFHFAGKFDAKQREGEAIHSAGSAGDTELSVSTAASDKAPDPSGYGILIYGSAAGLIAGFGFALLESAVFGAVNPGITLFRLFTAAPIHGACGARTGSAAMLLKKHPIQAFFRFLTAVMIHGIYNTLIVIPGFASIGAVLIAIFSLASSIMSIYGSMNLKNNKPNT